MNILFLFVIAIFSLFASSQVIVTGRDSGAVYFYDPESLTILHTITDPSFINPYGLILSKDGKLAFVANNGPNNTTNPGTVSVIDIRTKNVIKVIPVGVQPFSFAISPDGSTLYVANQNSSASNGSISIIDIQTLTAVGTIQNVGINPSGLATSLDGEFLYITNNTSYIPTSYGSVTIASTISKTVTQTINGAINGNPFPILISPNAYAFVAGLDLTQLNVINTVNNQLLPPVTLTNDFIDSLALSPDGSKLYISEGSDNLIEVLDTYSHAIIDSINITQTGLKGYLRINPEGTFGFLADLTGYLIKINLNTKTESISNLNSGSGLFGVGIYSGQLSLDVKSFVNRFPSQKIIQNIITWDQDLEVAPDSYYLYRDGTFLKMYLPNEKLYYQDNYLVANKSYRYTVIAKKQNQELAVATQLIITPRS